MTHDPSAFSLAALALLAFVAGIIDAIAGGSGLLTLPALAATGISPLLVLGTNKLQAVFSNLGSSLHFLRSGNIRFREHALPMGMAFVAAPIGTYCVSLINAHLLKLLIPLFLILIALWVIFSPKLGEVSRKARISQRAYSFTFAPLIAFYDGFFGPATGSFFALTSVEFRGVPITEATMRAKLYNFMSGAGSLLFFLIAGKVVWIYGAVMAVGMFAGGTLGARLVVKHGVRLIKPLLVIISLGMSLKLLLDY